MCNVRLLLPVVILMSIEPAWRAVLWILQTSVFGLSCVYYDPNIGSRTVVTSSCVVALAQLGDKDLRSPVFGGYERKLTDGICGI